MRLKSQYNDWSVVGDVFIDKNKSMVPCRCKCGTERIISVSELKTGKAKHCRSCGHRIRHYRDREILFWNKVKKGSENECWEWQGCLSPLGYGQVSSFAFGTSASHRVAWQYTHEAITKDVHVLHKCDNRKCCNPNHLFLGTHEDNMRDMRKKGRRKGINCGEKNGRAKLTYEDAEAIRIKYNNGDGSQQDIADEYGVSQFAISAIVRNKRYVKHE